MKIKMLPNWCKKLGFFLFLIGFVISFTTTSAKNSFYEGYYEAYSNTATPAESSNSKPVFIEKWFGDIGLHIIEVLIIVGLLIYMLSREKIEDDYINKLRLESYQLTSISSLLISIVLYIFLGNLKLSLEYFITLFLMSYLIIFALKKRAY
jgi:hypothetical protein